MRKPDVGDVYAVSVIALVLCFLVFLFYSDHQSNVRLADCHRRGYLDYDTYAGACFNRVYEPATKGKD
jgi:hypothetical protein